LSGRQRRCAALTRAAGYRASVTLPAEFHFRGLGLAGPREPLAHPDNLAYWVASVHFLDHWGPPHHRGFPASRVAYCHFHRAHPHRRGFPACSACRDYPG